MKKHVPPPRGKTAPKPKPPELCPVCGSPDVKRNRPAKGENECRTCGYVHDNNGKIV